MRSEVCISEWNSCRDGIKIGSRVFRVLLAEDDDAFRRLLAGALRRGGFEVIEARDGRELVDRLASLLPGAGPSDGMPIDLIVSDIRMPGITGLDVLDKLRLADWATPVILITAFGDNATRAEAIRLGATMFDKPFDLSDLRTMALHLTGR